MVHIDSLKSTNDRMEVERLDECKEEIVLLSVYGTEKMCSCEWVGSVQSAVSMLPTSLIYSLKMFCM